jgi:hypothetical protein
MDNSPLITPPRRLLCLFCALSKPAEVPEAQAVADLAAAIRADPGRPLALQCQSHDAFAFQSPGSPGEDSNRACFRQKQDLEILFRMDLAPGAVLPARIAVALARKAVTSVSGICGYGDATGPAWQGCPLAETDGYWQARETGMETLFPARDRPGMERDKAASLDAMRSAKAIRTRPHILMCAIAQYGRGVRPPFPDDNLPELLQHVLDRPETLIELVAGADAMMCAPCGVRCPDRGACLGTGFVHSGGLFNELKDLRILQLLGLAYGDIIPARDLFARILARIPTTVGACVLERSVSERSVWWDPCPCGGYEKGRRELLETGVFAIAGQAGIRMVRLSGSPEQDGRVGGI